MRAGERARHGRELDHEFVPRIGLAKRAKIKRQQSEICLPHVRRDFTADPSHQVDPFAAQPKRLSGRLATDVRVVIPQRRKERERRRNVAALRDLESAQQFGVGLQCFGGMQKPKRAGKSPGRRETLLRRELSRLPQSNRGQDQQSQPRATADKPRRVGRYQPCNAGDDQHRESRQPPGVLQPAPAPGLTEQDQRGNARDEEKDVIEIEHEDGESGMGPLPFTDHQSLFTFKQVRNRDRKKRR